MNNELLCSNNGTCVNDACVCPMPYTGVNCTEEICEFRMHCVCVHSYKHVFIILRICTMIRILHIRTVYHTVLMHLLYHTHSVDNSYIQHEVKFVL